VSGDPRRLYLVDASIYIFRAWYSIPDTLTGTDGEPINALHGFAGFLGGLLEETRPQHMAVVFDGSLTTSFRNELYPSYKANREAPPAALKRQYAMCRTLVEALGLAAFSSARFEADDLIGTLAVHLRRRGFAMVILSADKDLAQLLAPGDLLWDYTRRRRHHYETVIDWLGVHAGQVADWLALSGDAVDNIAGVPGIGAKTAAALLAEFGTLDRLFDGLEHVPGMKLRGAARVRRLLEEHREAALLARELTGIAIDPELKAGIRDVQRRRVTGEDIAATCERLGLGRMTTARLSRTAL
jgi:5'-3' exonuclease